MSPTLVTAYASQLPRLEAHESLRRASEIAVGSGSLRPEDARSVVREWQNAAGDAAGPRRRLTSAIEIVANAQAMGIKVERHAR